MVAAVPVASVDGEASLRASADEVICLNVPASFGAVGAFYLDFRQTTDEEVMALLRQCANGPNGRPA